MEKVRVRFAPSPTGPLHIGGVRTALYNYLFAKGKNGDFILRIEDTDQARTVPGAEQYIKDSLNWLGIIPDESQEKGGECGPYRQSERKEIYKEYAQKLLEKGDAYYAFDSPQEIESMKLKMESEGVVKPQYDSNMRTRMRNSLTLSTSEVEKLISSGEPYVIRVKIPANQEVEFIDEIREKVVVNTSALDDKVLMKSDGMPTYHLANVVDDHLMGITHVIRGEEWLPSAPLHVILYKLFGWSSSRPEFAHLPLIMKPTGKGKLSKRDGQKQGIPVFLMEWKDPESGEIYKGFKEEGYFPQTVINFLALLGWNPGTEQEVFSLQELCSVFSLKRISKGGARFDIEKAKWFNEIYLRNLNDQELEELIFQKAMDKSINCSRKDAGAIGKLMKDRVSFVHEILDNGIYLFEKPLEYDAKIVRKKWKPEFEHPFKEFAEQLEKMTDFEPELIKNSLIQVLEKYKIPLGKVMPVMRLAITGVGGGPDLMEIISMLGREEAGERIELALAKFNKNK